MLNYASKAIPDLIEISKKFELQAPRAARACQWLANTLDRSHKFLIPENGLVFGGDMRLDYSDMLDDPAARLPFSSIAVEFRIDPSFYPTFEHAPHASTRRLAVAVDLSDPAEWRSALEVFGPALVHATRGNSAACLIAGIDYIDPRDAPHGQADKWWPPWCALVAPYDQAEVRRLSPGSHKIESTVLKDGSYSAETFISYEPIPFSDLGTTMFTDRPLEQIRASASEYLLEASSVLSIIAALQCRNIETRVEAPPEKLQRARLRRGQRPLDSYHVLEVVASKSDPGGGGGAAGARAGVRTHWRRGHIRRLEGRRIWVNATVVKPGGRMLEKDYRIAAVNNPTGA